MNFVSFVTEFISYAMLLLRIIIFFTLYSTTIINSL